MKRNSAGKSALDVAKLKLTRPDLVSLLESVSNQPKSKALDRIPDIKKGERMLFLDGGGMRGLLELEVLMEIERRTGRKIIELFDWLVGTSVGGVICLSIVYGKLIIIIQQFAAVLLFKYLHICLHSAAEKTLEEIRQMLLRLRNVFSGGNKLFGAKSRTENMEELLKIWFGETRMDSKESPKYDSHLTLTLTLDFKMFFLIYAE